MVTTVLEIVWLVAAVCLIIVVLLHSPKGDGLGALGGQAQMFTSTKSAETTLNRATWTLAILFMGIATILSGGWLNTAPVGSSTEPVPIEQPVQSPLTPPSNSDAPTDNSIPSGLTSPDSEPQ